jgi:hypothetical protein
MFEHELYSSFVKACYEPLCQLSGTEVWYPRQRLQTCSALEKSLHQQMEKVMPKSRQKHFFAPDCNIHIDALQSQFGERT